MYPLTNKVKKNVKSSHKKLYDEIIAPLFEELTESCHIEHILSHLGDYAVLAERNKEKKTAINGREVELEALEEAHNRILESISNVIRWAMLNAVIIDLYSRSVIGWSMAPHMKYTLVSDALKMALFRRGFPQEVIVHSDRGRQYCSHTYRELLDDNQLKQSISRKGNCWDNACVGSFFHSLKVESIYDEPLRTRKEMRQAIFEYIEVDYNLARRHSAIGYLSPTQFEQLNVA